jgi:predicted transcriptional regulator
MDAQSSNPHLTGKIVGSYLRHHTVGATELPNLITSVHRALTEVGRPNPPEVPLTPAVSVRQSVRQDYVVCLDCGHRGKTLRRHISSRHGLSTAEYLKRWGLRQDHPLTAPAYSEHRSTLAKQLGLGRKQWTEAASEPATAEPAAANPDGEVQTTPRRRRTSRSRSKPDVESEAASAPTRSRPRRPRSRAVATQSEPLPTTAPDA